MCCVPGCSTDASSFSPVRIGTTCRTSCALRSASSIEHAAVIRKYNAGARFVKLDATGRLQIPKELIEIGALVKDVIISSVTTKMEIWDKSLYEATVGDIGNASFLQILKDNIK